MAKQSVMEMLKKPVRSTQMEPQSSPLGSMLEAEFHDMAMERIHHKAKASALEELQPRIDEAEARAATAEAELTAVKASLAAAQDGLVGLNGSHIAEKSAKDAANQAYEAECEKSRKFEIQVSQMGGRITELEKHNASLQVNLTAMMAEIGKRKAGFSLFPETRAAPVLPDFDVEVSSRGLKGEIKTVIIKPKR